MTPAPADRITSLSLPASRWRTSALGHAAATLPAELSDLVAHLRSCDATGGRLFALQCGGEAVHRFLAARIVTTVLIALALVGTAALAFQAA